MRFLRRSAPTAVSRSDGPRHSYKRMIGFDERSAPLLDSPQRQFHALSTFSRRGRVDDVVSLLLCSAASWQRGRSRHGAGCAKPARFKNLEARGGAAALAAIKNVTFEGRTVYPGDFELQYRETRERLAGGTADRVDFSLQGLDIIQAYDGHEGWKVNPLQGRKDAEKISADEVERCRIMRSSKARFLSSRTER